MTVEILCTDCLWESEVSASDDYPIRCPECGGEVINRKEPKQPEETKTDKI